MLVNTFHKFRFVSLIVFSILFLNGCDNFMDGAILKEEMENAIIVSRSVKVDDYSPRYTSNGVNCDSKISIKFTSEMSPLSFKDFSNISIQKVIKGSDVLEDITDLFRSVGLASDRRIVEVCADSDKIESVLDSDGSATIKVTVKKGVKDQTGKSLVKDFSFTYFVNSGREDNVPLFKELKIFKKKPSFDMQKYSFGKGLDEKHWMEIPAGSEGDVELHHVNRLYVYVKGYDADSGVKSLLIKESADSVRPLKVFSDFKDLGQGYAEGWFTWDFDYEDEDGNPGVFVDGRYEFVFVLSDNLNENASDGYVFHKDSVCDVNSSYSIEGKPYSGDLDAEVSKLMLENNKDYWIVLKGNSSKGIYDSWNADGLEQTLLFSASYTDSVGKSRVILPEETSRSRIVFKFSDLDLSKKNVIQLTCLDSAGNEKIDSQIICGAPEVKKIFTRKGSCSVNEDSFVWNDNGTKLGLGFIVDGDFLPDYISSNKNGSGGYCCAYKSTDGNYKFKSVINPMIDGCYVACLGLEEFEIQENDRSENAVFLRYHNGGNDYVSPFSNKISVPFFDQLEPDPSVNVPEVFSDDAEIEELGINSCRYKISLKASLESNDFESFFVHRDNSKDNLGDASQRMEVENFFFQKDEDSGCWKVEFEMASKVLHEGLDLVVSGIKGYSVYSTTISLPEEWFPDVTPPNITGRIHGSRPFFSFDDNMYMEVPAPSDDGGFQVSGKGLAVCTLYYTPVTPQYQLELWQPKKTISLIDGKLADPKGKLNIDLDYIQENFESIEGFFDPYSVSNVVFPIAQMKNDTQYLLLIYCEDAAGNYDWQPIYYFMTNSKSGSSLTPRAKLAVEDRPSDRWIFPAIYKSVVSTSSGYENTVTAYVLDKSEGSWITCFDGADLGAKYSGSADYLGPLTTVPYFYAYPPEKTETSDSVRLGKKAWNSYMKYYFISDNSNFGSPVVYGPYYSYTGIDSTKVNCEVWDISYTSKGMTIISDYPVFVHTIYSMENYGETPIEWEIHSYKNNEVSPKVVECDSDRMVGYYKVPVEEVPYGMWYTTIVYFANGKSMMSEPVMK